MNVRFWAWINNSPVKITLAPGQVIEHTSGGPTDEGWSWECQTFEFIYGIGKVERTVCRSGADCDGPHSSEHHQVADMQDLAANWIDEDQLAYPKWELQSSSQRDYYAEAMNY